MSRCHGALLIMFFASRGANSRNDELHVSINCLSQRANFPRTGDNAADPTAHSDFRQSYDLVRNVIDNSDFAQGFAVRAGQHRYPQQQESIWRNRDGGADHIASAAEMKR